MTRLVYAFSEGSKETREFEDFHSHNAQRLSVPEVEKLLLSLPEIQAELAALKS